MRGRIHSEEQWRCISRMTTKPIVPVPIEMDSPSSENDARRAYEQILVQALRYARRALPHGRAFEIAHDVAVEMTRRPAAVEQHGAVIYLAVTRRLRDGTRAAKRRAARESVYLELQSSEVPLSPSPDADVEAEELGDRIEETIGRMPRAMREIFLLVREEQLSYKAAAARLGISAGTVHTQLARAGALLRECVKKYHDDAPRALSSQPRKGIRG